MKLNKVTKTYKKNKEEIKVLENITYEFKKNTFYIITGESGSGKSTLLNIIGLLLEVDSGKIIENKEEINNYSLNKRIEFRKENIGNIFQEAILNEHLNVYENIKLPLLINHNISDSEKDEIVNNLIEKVGLKKRSTHYPNELSGGEQQRVCIARALVNKPSYLLCDEPTSSLDKKNKEKIMNYLKQISEEGTCVILVTHDKEIYKYGDILLELKDGNLLEMTYEN